MGRRIRWGARKEGQTKDNGGIKRLQGEQRPLLKLYWLFCNTVSPS